VVITILENRTVRLSTVGHVSRLISEVEVQCKLECGPMPNWMVALPNTGGALCSTPQSLADAHYYVVQ